MKNSDVVCNIIVVYTCHKSAGLLVGSVGFLLGGVLVCCKSTGGHRE